MPFNQTSNMDDKKLDTRLEVLRFLGQSSQDFLFLWEFQSDTLHFFGPVNRRFALHMREDSLCTLEDWNQIVYEYDRPLLKKELDEIRRGVKLEHNLEYRLVDRDGNRVWVGCQGRSQLDSSGTPVMMIGRVSDTILDRKVDPLTNVLNALKLPEDLNEILEAHMSGLLLLLGIDNLKTINIRHGREAGNRLLCLVAESLEGALDNRYRVYRLNGDCFAAVLTQTDKARAEQVYKQVRDRVSEYCTLSAGVAAFYGNAAVDPNTLCQYAEAALDRAKRLGKNTLAFFSPSDYAQRLSTLELQEELQTSVQQGFPGFSVCYQPQTQSVNYQIFGVEALLRYTSPTRGAISPSEFIPILEQTGLICPVGFWVLEQSLAQCRQWRSKLPQLHVSVNISYAQLSQENAAQVVLDALERSGLPGDALTLEVTESVQLQDYPTFNRIFYQWKKAGIEISVDDFGTGYSSLGYLKSLDISEIKIDRCFVSGIQHSTYNYRLLSNMVELARAAQIRVCCEGVETREELAALEQLRPDLLQGFLFDRPCTPEQFEASYLSSPDQESHMCRQLFGALADSSRCSAAAGAEPPVRDATPETVLDALDEIVYVSDLSTYDLYYLNGAGQKLTGIHDYKGRKCYKVLQNRDEPCEFCTNDCLKRDRFYIWERNNPVWGRHFLLKDKLIQWKGHMARLEIAMDVTDQEVVSQGIQEKLDFAHSVLTSAQALAEESGMDTATQRLLAQVGEFYQADRAYIFEPTTQNSEGWNNTHEWCRVGVSPERETLQGVSSLALNRWLGIFRSDRTVLIPNVDDLRETDPGEWNTLNRQGICRLIAVPIKQGHRLVGFLGVDNPRRCAQDDALIRMLTLFVANRFRHNETAERLSELLNLHYHDILKATEVGLWVIRMDREHKVYEMFVDETMRTVLGLDRELSPQDCYRYWYSRISDGYYHYVNLAVEQMASCGKVVQLEYTWVHPSMGEVIVRCTGVRENNQDGTVCLQGYHRIVNTMERPRFFTDDSRGELFEFNERRGTIYFHTKRKLLAGEAEHEENFPQCWLDAEMVHPHFVDKFQSLFRNVDQQEEQEGLELLLKGKSGEYEWFRLKTRHLGRKGQDRHTILVLLDPAGQQRITELELMRVREFYRASLSETIAYVEVDLESGAIKASGGLWANCQREYRRGKESLLQFMKRRAKDELLLLDPASQEFFRSKDWKTVFADGKEIQRIRYQRLVNDRWRWVELVAHSFREPVTENLFALLYLKDVDTQVRLEQGQPSLSPEDSQGN